MKKVLSVVIIALLAVTLLCACMEVDVSIAKLNKVSELLEVEYSGWTINTTTIYKDVKLTSSYIITKSDAQTEINYSVEQLNELSINQPTEFKSEIVGSVIVKDGKVTSQEGEELSVDLSGMENIGLNLKSEYLDEISVTSSTLSANVKDIKSFMGKEMDATNMTLEIVYSAEAIEHININYTTGNSASVKVEYIFSK